MIRAGEFFGTDSNNNRVKHFMLITLLSRKKCIKNGKEHETSR